MNRIITASLIVPLALGGAACSDRTPAGPDNTTTPHEPPGIVVSNPRSSSTPASALGGRTSISFSSEATVAYVSVVPGTYPGAVDARIRNRTAGGAVKIVEIVEGGFDPVAVEAKAGDELDLTFSMNDMTITMTLEVPPRRPPAVVRSDPPTGRIDVALNQALTVIFSEPIDPTSLSAASVRLVHDGEPVSGTVALADNGWTADFFPDNPLEPLARYELVVTQDIRDLDGDALEVSYSVTFVTGTFGITTSKGITIEVLPFQNGCSPPLGFCEPRLPESLILDETQALSFSAPGLIVFPGVPDGVHTIKVANGDYGGPVICGFWFDDDHGGGQEATVMVKDGESAPLKLHFECF